MAKRYEVKFNGVILLKSSTKRDAEAFMRKLNKDNMRIKSIAKKIEDEGGQVFGTVYLDRVDGDYEYPIKQKRI